jgi:Domain of unknown function (DUF4062)
MAAPRIFVSSTFYDLRQIRADLELFIREMGYEPVLHERGAISYGSTEKLEEYAYKEVDLADILVSIVGGRFGTASRHEDRSISQEELKRALERNIQVYIFVEQVVLTEYQTYKANKNVEGLVWSYVDDPRIYKHLELTFALPNNNAIQGFETAADITGFLKQQWAGLFRSSLQDQAKSREFRVLEDIQTTVATLDRVVEFLAAERGDQNQALDDILGANHPFFARLRELFHVRYPLYLRTLNEVNRWLVDAQDFRPFPPAVWDDDMHREWGHGDQYLRMSESLFDSRGRLRPLTPKEWNDDMVELLSVPLPSLVAPGQ